MTDLAHRSMTVTQAHFLTTRIQRGIEDLDAALREAIDGNIHEALGYATLTDWWVEEVGSARLSGELRDMWITQIRLDRPEMSQRGIASAVGTSQPTVHRILNPVDSSESVPPVSDETESRPTPTPGSSDAANEPSVDPGTNPEHYEARGWKGDEPGSCGVACVCGVELDGFDSLNAAREELARHIESPGPAGPHPAGSGQGEAPSSLGAAVPPPGSPATWTPEQHEANRREVQAIKIRESGIRHARDVVSNLATDIGCIIDGFDLGERHLITGELVAELYAQIDRLNARIEVNA